MMPESVRRVLLACGILASGLYVATDIVAATHYDGYSYTAQAVSELSAIGSPMRPLMVLSGLAYCLLMIAFGVGVWESAGQKRALRGVGSLAVVYGALGLTAPFFPMHQRGMEGSLTDTLHILLTGVTVLTILISVGFGGVAFGRRFHLYSVATVLVLIVFGTLAGLDGPRLAEGLPTPWLGVTERINIGSYLLWVAVLALTLLRAQARRLGAGSGKV